jgi:preprotein translocase subunit YajC
MNGIIAMFILVIVIANVGGIYFLIQDRREAKRKAAKKLRKKQKAVAAI